MEEQKMTCIYHPTTVVVVDDNPSVLQNIQLTIGEIVPCKTFSVPEEALDYLEKDIKKNNALNEIIKINVESDNYTFESEQLPLQYDISQIHKIIYEKDRFSKVSLVVVDFAMPSMNGEEFCTKLRKVKGSTIKIIMLTGEANDPKAIQLFNSGVIDRFLRKAQHGTDEDLKKCIAEMQNIYFRDLTFQIVQGLSSEQNSSLGDPDFIKFFNKICHDISASSYYLIEISGSFLFLNNAGKPTWLIIKTLKELEEISHQIESHISEEIIASIHNGEVVPYFGGLETEIKCFGDEEELKKHLYKAEKLIGKKTYCYALLDELPGFPLERDKILSFNQYMSSL